MLKKTNFIVHKYIPRVLIFLSTTKLFLNSVQKKIAVNPKSINAAKLSTINKNNHILGIFQMIGSHISVNLSTFLSS